MRKTLLLILAFAPLFSFGQAFEFGLRGGISTNTAPIDAPRKVNYKETGLLPSYAGACNLLLNFSSWQIGASIEAYELKTKYDQTTLTPAGDMHSTGTNTYAAPQVPLLMVINKLIYNRKSYAYIGVAGWSGVNFLKGMSGHYNELQTVLGGQVGYTYGFSNAFGLNAELAVRYNGSHNRHIVAFPVTVGIRFRP